MDELVDEQGRMLTPSHAVKKGWRCRYYVSQAVDNSSQETSGWRVPAGEIESRIAEVATAMLEDRAAVAQAALAADVAERDSPNALDRVGES